MRVLVTGAHGQVGQELLRLVPDGIEAVGMGSNELDITDPVRVNTLVDELAPQLLINAAAYTAVDKAESEAVLAWAVNCEGVAHLAQAAERLGIPLLHISTDYVFAGDAEAPYKETDETHPTGVYGASKLGGEKALAQYCERHIVLRTSWVFGQYGHNFVKTMLKLTQERDTLGIVADQHGGPTGAASIAQALWNIAAHLQAGKPVVWGTYHFSGAPATTWFEFAAEIFNLAHAQGLIQRIPTVNAIVTSDYPTPAKRPENSVLSCERIEKVFGISQPDWREELKGVLVTL